MNQTTLSKMKLMALHGMQNAFKTAIETGRTEHYTLNLLPNLFRRNEMTGKIVKSSETSTMLLLGTKHR